MQFCPLFLFNIEETVKDETRIGVGVSGKNVICFVDDIAFCIVKEEDL